MSSDNNKQRHGRQHQGLEFKHPDQRGCLAAFNLHYGYRFFIMQKQRLLVLFLLIAYIFSPTLFTWMINPEGSWYRPYIIWIMLIIAAFVLHKRQDSNDL